MTTPLICLTHEEDDEESEHVMGDHLPSHRFSVTELEDIEASYQCCSNANEIQPERRVVTGNEWRCYQCHNQSCRSVDDIEDIDNTCPLIAE